MIELDNVSYRYRNGENVLENINVKIDEGECICILGNNGAGKSTLAKLISGIIKPTIGHVLVDDIDTCNKKQSTELRKKVGIVFQNPENQIIFSNVYDDLAFAIKNLKLDNEKIRIEKALEKVQMSDYIENQTFTLSLGQKQRITIASILAINTKYIVLDESTAMLDTKGKEEIYNIIKNLKQEGYTIIYTTNIANEMLLADRIILIENKSIVEEILAKDIIDKIPLLKKHNINLPDILEIVDNLNKNRNTFKFR